MSVTPLDLQTNMSQIHEVGKGEQVKTTAVAEQQHVLDKESDEKSKLKKSRLEENKSGEKTSIKDEEKYKDKERGGLHEKNENSPEGNDEKKERTLSKDDRMGRIIDVLK